MLIRENSWPCPTHIEQAMRRRAWFLADMRRPDGLCPHTGDGQQASPDSYLRKMVDLGASLSLEHVVTNGRRGPRPDHESSYYPWMGTAVVRSGWEADANYLMCDMGAIGDVHAHEAKLAIEVAAFGRTLIADKGVHTYSREERHCRWYRFLGGTRGHSTVSVDGLCQMRLVGAETSLTAPLDNQWHSSPVFDCLTGVYDEGWGPVQFTEPMRSAFPPPPFEGEIDVWVTHRRTVLYVRAADASDSDYWVVSDRMSGSGPHVYEQLFHFVAVEGEVHEGTKSLRTATPGAANLALVPVQQENLEFEVVEGRDDGAEGLLGWHVVAGEMVPAPCAVYRRRCTGTALMQTVLWPLRPGDDRLPTVEPLGGDEDGWLRVRLPDGERRDIICVAAETGRHQIADDRVGTMRFEGSAAVLRLDGGGSPRAWDTVGGTGVVYDGEDLA